MYLKKALFLSLFVLGISSVNAQPISHSTMGHGYFSRGELMRENKNYVGSTHQLDHYIKYLPVTWSQDVESELLIALNEFELGHNQAITMLEDFIENHKYEPLAMVARAKLGDYYFYHGDYEQALLNYEQVREKALDDDSDENVLYRRAYCDLMLNNYDNIKESNIAVRRLSSTPILTMPTEDIHRPMISLRQLTAWASWATSRSTTCARYYISKVIIAML